MATRMQVPLKLAWAISIHKSQGMTIHDLHVDLHGVFESGQSYVALSRASSLAGLALAGFEPACIRAHPTALAFHESIGDGPNIAIPADTRPTAQTPSDPTGAVVSPRCRGASAAASAPSPSSAQAAVGGVRRPRDGAQPLPRNVKARTDTVNIPKGSDNAAIAAAAGAPGKGSRVRALLARKRAVLTAARDNRGWG